MHAKIDKVDMIRFLFSSGGYIPEPTLLLLFFGWFKSILVITLKSICARAVTFLHFFG